jgi:hypothetical protein
VRLWRSEKQEACVRGIAAEFPGVPHRYCTNHFLRDVAQPVLEADSRAKVYMRHKVRGLRTIAREVLAERRPPAQPALAEAHSEATPSDALQADEDAQAVVLDDCAAVRGILNDDQGGPLHPPGLRMAEALEDVHASLQRHRAAKKGGRRTSVLRV